MTTPCRQLFEYAMRHVTPKDVSDFCPSDPGYADYVREFTTILSSGIPPIASHFDITETIGLTRWSDASQESAPARFRRFRTFTNAVGLMISAGPEGPDDGMPANYFAVSLLDDAHALQDPELLSLLFPAFGEFHQRVAETEWVAGEAAFLLLGQLMLALMGVAPSTDIAAMSEQVIAEAAQCANRATSEFLWGCTFFDQLHDRWKHFVTLTFSRDATHDSTAALRDALLSSPCAGDASPAKLGCSP